MTEIMLYLIQKKTKQKPRRVSDHSTQGHPQNEMKKVKRCLKKVSQSTKDTSVKAEVGTEQPRRNHRKSANHATPEHLDHSTETQSNKLRVEMEVEVTKSTDGETFEELPRTDSPVNDLQDHPHGFVSDKQRKDTGNDKDRDILTADQSGNDKQLMDDQTGSGIHKSNKRRASSPAKHDNLETGLPSVTKVPSYMAATESAKAKVRGQASPRSGKDGYEKNGLTRLHSLPSSANANLSSSPRVLRLVQASGRGGTKTNRSLSPFRDDKSIQEWRR